MRSEILPYQSSFFKINAHHRLPSETNEVRSKNKVSDGDSVFSKQSKQSNRNRVNPEFILTQNLKSISEVKRSKGCTITEQVECITSMDYVLKSLLDKLETNLRASFLSIFDIINLQTNAKVEDIHKFFMIMEVWGHSETQDYEDWN